MSPLDIALVGAAVNGLAWTVAIDRRHGRNTALKSRLALLAVAGASAEVLPLSVGPVPRPPASTAWRRRTASQSEASGPRITDPAAKPPVRNQFGKFASKGAAEAASGLAGDS